MNNSVSFDEVPTDGSINFGIGQPSTDLLPLEIVKVASDHFFKNALPQEINYGPAKGDEPFLSSLAAFLSRQYGKQANINSLFTTNGNSQALDFVCSTFSNPGDTIFIEEPSYFLAAKIFRDNHLNIVGVPTDEEGLDIDRLEEMLKKNNPSLLYTIPVYHNPGGQTMSVSKRNRLIELSKKHGFLIIADEVYQMLNYYKKPPAAFGTMIDSHTVVSLGSFSKILAPGMRLGWIQTSPKLIASLTASGFINSGGCVNQFTANIVRCTMELGLLETHLEIIRDTYRSRLEAMDAALSKAFGEVMTWTSPKGGYFFWLQLNENIDTGKLRHRAVDYKTGFQAGERFSSTGKLKNYLRLSFACYNEAEIRKGITRLKGALEL